MAEQPRRERALLWFALGVVGGMVLACIIFTVYGSLRGAGTATPAAQANAQGMRAPTTPSARPTWGAPTPMQAGLTRTNAAPFGQTVTTDDGFEITVLGLERGQAAWSTIHGDSYLNAEPKKGMEYILATVRIKYLGDADDSKRVNSLYFRVTGEKGEIYNSPLLLVLNKEPAEELFGGGSTEGQLAFEVTQGEKGLTMIYSGAGMKARFLSLESQ